MHGAGAILLVRCAVTPISRCIDVACVQPDRAVVAQNALEFIEGSYDVGKVVVQAIVASNLLCDVLVS